MKEVNRVMVCVDLSDYSKMIIEYTLSIFKGLSTEILLFNVLNSRDVDALEGLDPDFLKGFSVSAYKEREKAERRHKIKELIEEYFPEDIAQMSISIDVGIPFDSILKAIKTENIDLVVAAASVDP